MVYQFRQGNYDIPEDYNRLRHKIQELESIVTGSVRGDRLFYLAVPPDVFNVAVKTAREVCWSSNGWNRVVVEKPFGRDFDSAMDLASNLLKVLNEDEVRDNSVGTQ